MNVMWCITIYQYTLCDVWQYTTEVYTDVRYVMYLVNVSILFRIKEKNISKMDVKRLNVLYTVEEIIGSLLVNGKPTRGKAKIQNLKFLSKLRVIHSQGQATYVSLRITVINLLFWVADVCRTGLSINPFNDSLKFSVAQ